MNSLLQKASIMEGNDPVTGHIISTTIGGKNGEPKQVGYYGTDVLVNVNWAP